MRIIDILINADFGPVTVVKKGIVLMRSCPSSDRFSVEDSVSLFIHDATVLDRNKLVFSTLDDTRNEAARMGGYEPNFRPEAPVSLVARSLAELMSPRFIRRLVEHGSKYMLARSTNDNRKVKLFHRK